MFYKRTLPLGILFALALSTAVRADETWRQVVVFQAALPTGQSRTIVGQSRDAWPSEIACVEAMQERKAAIQPGTVLPNGATVLRVLWRCVLDQPGRPS